MPKAKSSYDVHPGVEMMRKWLEDLPTKTGRSIEQWSDVYRANVKKHPARKDLQAAMKEQYGLGTNSAWHIYEYTFERSTWDGEPEKYLANAATFVEEMYAGSKAHFRPLFDAVIAYARSLGDDVKVCPCKTMVPLYRSRVFAEMRPATKTRFELALCIDDVPFDDVLKLNPRAKGNDRQRRLITMETIKDFTPTVKKWLKYAYVKDKS